MDRGMGSTRLRKFIERKSGTLLGTLGYYLFRAGMANRSQTLDAAAEELLNEIIAEALAHEDRFRPSGQPRAWLLGIAANLIKRRQAELRRREQREQLIRDLYPQDDRGEDELFD
jgi:DNA-directed RNA polymerase specialized sigma24 family protein